MKYCPLLVLAGLLVGCASAPGPRTVVSEPRAPLAPTYDYPLPTPSWPLREGIPAPRILQERAPDTPWMGPPFLAAVPGSDAVAEVLPMGPPGFPLPGVLPSPVKITPASRSWTPVTQAKTPNLPVPMVSARTTAVPKSANKGPKEPTTTPVQPQPAAKPAVSSPATPAASASLLPSDKTTAGDFRWEDVNAVVGDAVTLHFDKTNWLYLDSPAQQKILGFQSINREKDSTTFQFRPQNPGQYTLEFQRQDLVNQSTEVRRVKLTVVAQGTRTSASGTVLAPQISTTAATDALEASRQLAASGKTSEAVQKLLQSYKADDARINLELARLLNQTGQDDEALKYLDKNLNLPGADFQGTLELGTRLAATRDPQRKLPAYVKLWTVGTLAPPEDLFVQVFEALRTQKLAGQAKDWSARYDSWYPSPQFRDRYLFQLGQFLEEPGDNRDIRGAWKAYNEIVGSYPLSPLWKPAGERAAYLNRHFLQVR